MEIVGFIASVLMGVSLGLMGGGGSILTVPILVYLFGVNPVLSISYSLFVVGMSSLVGSYSHFKRHNLDIRTALFFGIPSILSVYVARKFVVPFIPDPVFSIGDISLTKDAFLLILFSILMVAASVSMIRRNKNEVSDCDKKLEYNFPLIAGEGLLVGTLTGLVGAGGGFLIIPALIFFSGMCMKKAVGSSLLIIALNSLVGFTTDVYTGIHLNITFMLMFAGFATLGIIAGTIISKHISNEKLKPAFGWFVLAMGLYIIGKEILLTI